MPLAINDTLPTIQTFLKHWDDTEAALGHPFTLADGSSSDTLRALHEAFYTAQQDGLVAENSHQGAIQARDNARKDVLPTALQARKAIRGLLPESEQVKQLPKRIPSITADVQTQLVALRDVLQVWESVNALPTTLYPTLTRPLVVRIEVDNVLQSRAATHFQLQVATLSMAAETLVISEQGLRQAHANRDLVRRQVDGVLKKYRATVTGLLPRTSTLVRTLPTLAG